MGADADAAKRARATVTGPSASDEADAASDGDEEEEEEEEAAAPSTGTGGEEEEDLEAAVEVARRIARRRRLRRAEEVEFSEEALRVVGKAALAFAARDMARAAARPHGAAELKRHLLLDHAWLDKHVKFSSVVVNRHSESARVALRFDAATDVRLDGTSATAEAALQRWSAHQDTVLRLFPEAARQVLARRAAAMLRGASTESAEQ